MTIRSSGWGQSLHVDLASDVAYTVDRVPNTPGTPRRTIRIPDQLWDAAQQKASDRGENLSDVIRKALERYVRRTK